MKLSVLVCTRNRAHAILPCLDSIAASLAAAAPAVGPGTAEIVVVDNASTDNTAALVRTWAETCAFPVRLVHEPKKGVSCARNSSLRAATGDLLAFTDDDCRLSVDYVTQALKYDAADTVPVLRGGRVELGDPTDLPLTIKTLPEVKRWQLRSYPAGKAWLGDNILGCNMLMRRSVAEGIGFFDERLGTGSSIPGGEETDYTFRAYFSGVMLEYVPDMAVFHHHGRKTLAEAQKFLRNYGVGTGAVYAKYMLQHPLLLRQLYWDARKALLELCIGGNRFMPEMNFTHRQWTACCIKGFVKYTLLVAEAGLKKLLKKD